LAAPQSFVSSNGTLTVSGTINNAGFGLILDGPGGHLLSGVVSGAGSLVKDGSGGAALSGLNLYTGATMVIGGTLLVNGSLAAGSTLTVAAGATLGGTGVIKGPATVGLGATLAPGNNGIGRLTVSNRLVLAGNTIMEISRNGNASTNDVAFVTGTLTEGGSLVVTNLGTNALALNDSFKLFNASAYVGVFTNFTLPALAASLSWDTSGLTNNGTLAVKSAPPVRPIVGFPTLDAQGYWFLFSGPIGQAYTILTATNVGLPLAQWDIDSTGVFGPSGVAGLTNLSPDDLARFYRVASP
jgi:autotransporter-associated beta strand protein